MKSLQSQSNTKHNIDHYRLTPERSFHSIERERVTILFGGLTWKHERLIQGLLEAEGYLCERIPDTDRVSHELGKEFCANGLCNPVYFTIGSLLKKLRALEDTGLSRQHILDHYVFFTAACGGPCRFGLYEAEFRSALKASGFEGFRILSFSQDQGIHASTGHSGMKFSVDFGLNALHAFVLGDLLNDLQHRLRAFEVHQESTDRTIRAISEEIAESFRGGAFELEQKFPRPLRALLPNKTSRAYRIPNTLGKIWSHLLGPQLPLVLDPSKRKICKLEVDWLRVKPVVKVTGEFWAQMTESDGNFRMLEFLEKEGAEVAIEPISSWVLYMAHQRVARAIEQYNREKYSQRWNRPFRAFKLWLKFQGKQRSMRAGAKIYLHHYNRLARLLGGLNHGLSSQEELAALAQPHFNTFLRGGEGHLEIGKNLYYTKHKASHMVLALKPFGCLPSTQSDGVQAALVERYPEMNFVSIETASEGAIHAYSRVQMALSEAKAKARDEFRSVLKSTGQSLEDVQEFVQLHPELRHPLYPIPRREGVISTAANFLLHVNDLMNRHRKYRTPRAFKNSVFEDASVHTTQEVGNA